MPSLVIPESGLLFGSSQDAPSKPGSIPSALGLALNDSVIEEMIRCVQNGKPIQLSLGDHPSLQYGSKVQNLSTSPDPFTHELYHTNFEFEMSSSNPNPMKGIKKVENKPHAAFLAMFIPKKLTASKKNPTNSSVQSSITKMSSATAGADAALAQLQSSLASENAKKAENTTKYIKDGSGLPGPPVKKGQAGKVTNKSKFLSQNRLGNDTTRSLPSSPALSGIGSPALGPTSIPPAEQAKAARKPVVHLLALGPMTEKDVLSSLPNASSNDVKQALQKVGDLNSSTNKWELRKNFWKELDVWTFKYDSPADRQRVIDNAVKQYDRSRLGVSEPEWDRLLPKSERGTGKCLSKLQAQIAHGPVARAPKINVHSAEDSGRDTPAGKDDDEEVFDKNLSKVKEDTMARSASQPPATKSKKVSEKEAQAKRLLSKSTTKPAPKPAPARKEKPKPVGKVLSSQFVSDSDEEDDYIVPAKPAPKPAKRPREDDGETSDSSVPLSKKVKKDGVSDASQTSRTTNSSTYTSSSGKTKGNSPQKSSPLASSPPTNASEFENSSGGRTSSSASPAAHNGLKTSRSPIHKRHQKSSSVTSSSSSGSQRSLKPEVMDLARKYRSYYPKYAAMHKEVASLGRRDLGLEDKLLDMHSRLAKMKKEILEGVVES